MREITQEEATLLKRLGIKRQTNGLINITDLDRAIFYLPESDRWQIRVALHSAGLVFYASSFRGKGHRNDY
jgi:hypothetical protein